jgi:hypothetical protein
MIITDTSIKHNKENNMEQQEAEEKESIAAEQQKQLKREQLAMLDTADLLNRF